MARALPSKTCSTTSPRRVNIVTSTHLLLPLAAKDDLREPIRVAAAPSAAATTGEALARPAARTGRYVYEVPSAVQAQLRSRWMPLRRLRHRRLLFARLEPDPRLLAGRKCAVLFLGQSGGQNAQHLVPTQCCVTSVYVVRRNGAPGGADNSSIGLVSLWCGWAT